MNKFIILFVSLPFASGHRIGIFDLLLICLLPKFPFTASLINSYSRFYHNFLKTISGMAQKSNIMVGHAFIIGFVLLTTHNLCLLFCLHVYFRQSIILLFVCKMRELLILVIVQLLNWLSDNLKPKINNPWLQFRPRRSSQEKGKHTSQYIPNLPLVYVFFFFVYWDWV